MVTIRIDHKLRVPWAELPPAVTKLIIQALSIPNIEREKAKEQRVYGWEQMPQLIYLWERDGEDLVMPRGFFANLFDGLKAFDIEYSFDDHRVFENELPMPENPIDLHPWQMPAVQAIRIFEQGIWKAPAGSGKTVGVLEAIRRSKTPSIVLVNTKDILYQWQDRAKTFLGADFPVGLIGDGVFEVSDFLTIATVQTINSRFESLEKAGFFDQFSFFCLDECHHATADTYNKIVDRFSARIRIGVSATPDKTGDFALATHVLGPIFHETKKEDVSSIIQPEIFKIPTSFSFKFRERVGRVPSNYITLLKFLTADNDRNFLIVKSLMIDEGSHALVISKRIEHLKTLSSMLADAGYTHPRFMLTGNQSSDERNEIVEEISKAPGVVFSTLADEALDIPRLDSLFLVFPQRNAGLINQQVGRVCRAHPDKERAVVYDFVDSLVGPLDSQWRARSNQVYRPNHYPITVVRSDDILNFDLAS